MRPHDYCVALLDGQKIATLDRRRGEKSLSLPNRAHAARLDLLVDTFGHINYGSDMFDPKGITHRVSLAADGATNELRGWDVFRLPFDARELRRLKFRPGASANPAFYRGAFRLSNCEDTFLDLSKWGKGLVWVNGHNLGRYWNIGPQQTLYCPAPWLKKGKNEIIVFEIGQPQEPVITGRSEPILDKLTDRAQR